MQVEYKVEFPCGISAVGTARTILRSIPTTVPLPTCPLHGASCKRRGEP